MTKIKNHKFLIVVLVIIGTLATVYFSLAYLYSRTFVYGIWINGEYCTGRSIEEVNECLSEDFHIPTLVINEPDGKAEFIYLKNMDYRPNFEYELNRIADSYNPFLWVTNIFRDKISYDISPVIEFNRQLLWDDVMSLDICKYYDSLDESEIYIYKDESGYNLYNNIHEFLDKDKLYEVIEAAVTNGNEIVIDDSFFYEKENSLEDKKTNSKWSKLTDFLSTKIVYDMGDTLVPIDSTVLTQFLVDDNGYPKKDKLGNFIIDDEKIDAYVESLCADYDTYTLPRKYVSCNNEEKVIDFALRGQQIDAEAEKEYLKNAIRNGVEEVHIPKYLHEGFSRGLDDIGPDYIEIDISRQKLYFFLKNELVLETDVVTGKPSAGWSTATMLCYIYAKTTDAILRGEGYASPVDYWMPVYKGIGLHDASWQSAFGGDLYLTKGSRGCINLPDSAATFIYENSYVGIPVIIYN